MSTFISSTFPLLPFVLIRHAYAISPALSATSESNELIPFNPQCNPYMTAAILETSFLTMSLKCHHLHTVSKIHDIYSLGLPLGQRNLVCLKRIYLELFMKLLILWWTPSNHFSLIRPSFFLARLGMGCSSSIHD